ncbi:MAG: hypothetical protein J6Z06_07550, partial [Lachnospiraceae bacterium]|nr:hypothetical protein [Lachnospiraceae bacterium]
IAFEGDSFTAIFYPYVGELRYFLENVRDYVYLPNDDMVIPKVLATSIPKELKQRAKKENCYTKKTGRFLALPSGGLLHLNIPHLFHQSYGDTITYADCEELPADSDFMISYLIGQLKTAK